MYKNLYKGTAYYYARYRPGYPDKFFAHVIKKFKLDGTSRLLDLGCGTGQLAIPLASYFEKVVAMDPDSRMLEEGKRAAKRVGIKNILWVKGGSDDIRVGMGKFRLVVIGRAFHWMNQKKTLRALHKIIEPHGGVVIVSRPDSGNVWNAHWNSKEPWREAVKDAIQKYLGEERRAGSGHFVQSLERFEDSIKKSPFKRFETYEQEIPQTSDIGQIIGNLYSSSFASKNLLGKNISAFERDMKKALKRINASGKFARIDKLEAFILQKE